MCLLIIGAITVGLSVGACGKGNIDSKPRGLEQFKEDIRGLYTGEMEAYTIIDDAGNDATALMQRETKEFAEKEDWQSIYQYFLDYIHRIEKSETFRAEESGMLELDLSKTETKAFSVKLTPISGMNYPVYNYFVLRCQVKGTIYYDPNTYKISNTMGPWVLNSSVDGGGSTPTVINKIPVVSGDGYSAMFESVINSIKVV